MYLEAQNSTHLSQLLRAGEGSAGPGTEQGYHHTGLSSTLETPFYRRGN